MDQEWIESFIETWLDDSCRPRPEHLQDKGYLTIPVADVLNPMEAEWLTGAIRSSVTTDVRGVTFEFRANFVAGELELSRDGLLGFSNGNSEKFVCVTSLRHEFLYYKDQLNRFFLLCGTPDFLQMAYPMSVDTARMMYFDEWVSRSFNSDEERRFLEQIWKRYAPPPTFDW